MEDGFSRADLLARRVIDARDAAGLNNTRLAILSGVPRRTIVRITNGHNKERVNLETLEAIADATGVAVAFFAEPSTRVVEATHLLVAALLDELRDAISRDAAKDKVVS